MNFSEFPESLFNKVADWKPLTLFQKGLRYRHFPVNFKNTFLEKTLDDCFCFFFWIIFLATICWEEKKIWNNKKYSNITLKIRSRKLKSRSNVSGREKACSHASLHKNKNKEIKHENEYANWGYVCWLCWCHLQIDL